ncbi:MAG: hypothetical protein HY689_10405 [Chloroflexi bacterium]|nr:hypothetical protein [Chloroflexota bacterium]
MTPETLRQWVRRVEVDAGARPGLTTDERKRLKELEWEHRELRRENEILNAASSALKIPAPAAGGANSAL